MTIAWLWTWAGVSLGLGTVAISGVGAAVWAERDKAAANSKNVAGKLLIIWPKLREEFGEVHGSVWRLT